jgi:hypothetical protein
MDGEFDGFFSGRRDAAAFDLDSESDACVGLDVEADDFGLERSDAPDFDVDSESLAWDLDWDCDDFFSRFSGRSEVCDFGRGSGSDARLDLDGECADFDRVTGTSDLIASLDRVTE